MSDTTIRRIEPGDADWFLAADELVWADDEAGDRQDRLQNTPTRAGFAAEQDGELAGISASWDIELAVPSGMTGSRLVPAEGLTWVGVHPDHRRRGVLSAMMRHHLRWTRDEGRSLAALKASEPGIYGRFGYGLAAQSLKAKFGRGAQFAAPSEVSDLADATRTTFRTASPDDAQRLHALMRRCAVEGACGAVVRHIDDLRRLLTDIPEQRRDRERNRLLWATRDGKDVGYALLRRTHKWDDGLPGGEIDVFMFGSTDTGARLALMRRLVDFDLMGSAINWMPLDDPLLLWSPSPRGLGSGVTDSLWLRIVDLSAAIAERGFAAPCDVRIAVQDKLIEENDRVWHWVVDADGTGALEPAAGEADLSLDIVDLGAVWLGGQTLGARHAAGFVRENSEGAVAALGAALRTASQPTKAVDF